MSYKRIYDMTIHELQHSGVKGMKWGVRKGLTKERTESRVTETANGSKLTLSGDRTPAMGKFLARMSPKIQKEVNNTSSFKLENSSGDKVGEMLLYKESKSALNVVWVDVNSKHQGKGYATAAMKAAVQFAESEKLSKVTLEVPGSSPDARHIYEKLGFKDKGSISEKDDVWGGLTKMELDLKQ